MSSTEIISSELLTLNQERLASVIEQPHSGLLVDVHGFLYASKYLAASREHNELIAQRLAELASGGLPLAAVTGYGDRIDVAFTRPLQRHLEASRIDPRTLPIFLSTRNGALTTHAYTREIIDSHPIPHDMHREIRMHPLVIALSNLVSDEVRANHAREYADTIASLGYEPHPHRGESPGLRLDWHNSETPFGYQITAIYQPNHIREIARRGGQSEDLKTLLRYAQVENADSLPDNPLGLLPVLQRELVDVSGLPISFQTAGSHPEIDMLMAGVNKSVGARALVPQIARYWNISEEDVIATAVAGGDSPFQNDGPLLSVFDNKITNVMSERAINEGIVVLDMPDATDDIDRTYRFLQQFRTMGS